MANLAVTGSTGAIGGLVAADIAARGLPQRLLVRKPSRAPQLPATEVHPCEYGDRDAALRALDGVQTLLMVSASESADRLERHRTFVTAAAEAGVEHIVYTSFYGAAADCTFTLGRDHFATEGFIRDSGVAHTFLRDNFYLDIFPYFVGTDGVIRGPAGDGRVAAVARADVARCASAVLTAPKEHRGVSYDLTGPEALTLAEIAAIIGEASGKEVSYHDETVEEAYESRRQWEAPQWQYDAWVSTYTAIRAGELAHATDHVKQLTGQRPLRLADILAE